MMAARSGVAAMLLLLAWQLFTHARGVHGKLKDYGFESPMAEDFSPISKGDLEALIKKDLGARGSSEVNAGGGRRQSEDKLWSGLGIANAVGERKEGENSGSKSQSQSKSKSKPVPKSARVASAARKTTGMHGGGKGMHGSAKGMHKGKGMHFANRRPRVGKRSTPVRVVASPTPDIVVAKDGSGDYPTVQAALNAASRGSASKPFVIYIKGGDYVEKCLVPSQKQFLTLVGDKGRTRIRWNDAASTLTGRWAYNTPRTASFTILADDFTAVDITFENFFGWPNGREAPQAVAVMVSADRAQFYGCTFMGYQDTLFSWSGRHYFHKCHIIGTVDFIFGAARTIFQDCLIEVLSNAENRYTAVAAHKRPSESDNSGFVFRGGRMIGTGTEFARYGTILGRTWGPWCTIVYLRVQMDCPVVPEGWNNMEAPNNEKHSILLAYGNTGVGVSQTSSWEIGRVASAAEIGKYDGLHFIDGTWVTIPSWWKE